MKAVKFKWHTTKKTPKPNCNLLLIVHFENGILTLPGCYMKDGFFDNNLEHITPISKNRVLAWGYFPKKPKKFRETIRYCYID